MRAGPDEKENVRVCVCVCVSLEIAAKAAGVPSGSRLRQEKMSTLFRLTEARSRRLLLAVGSEHHQREILGVGAGTPVGAETSPRAGTPLAFRTYGKRTSPA